MNKNKIDWSGAIVYFEDNEYRVSPMEGDYLILDVWEDYAPEIDAGLFQFVLIKHVYDQVANWYEVGSSKKIITNSSGITCIYLKELFIGDNAKGRQNILGRRIEELSADIDRR